MGFHLGFIHFSMGNAADISDHLLPDMFFEKHTFLTFDSWLPWIRVQNGQKNVVLLSVSNKL